MIRATHSFAHSPAIKYGLNPAVNKKPNTTITRIDLSRSPYPLNIHPRYPDPHEYLFPYLRAMPCSGWPAGRSVSQCAEPRLMRLRFCVRKLRVPVTAQDRNESHNSRDHE